MGNLLANPLVHAVLVLAVLFTIIVGCAAILWACFVMATITEDWLDRYTSRPRKARDE